MKYDLSKVGENIKRHRAYSGLSQRELARQIKTTHAWLCLVEQGKKLPSLSMLTKLCEVLHCSIEDIVETEFNYLSNEEIRMLFGSKKGDIV